MNAIAMTRSAAAVLSTLVLCAWTLEAGGMSVRLTSSSGEIDFVVFSNSPAPLPGMTGRTPVDMPAPPAGVHVVFAAVDGTSPLQMRLFTGHPEIRSTNYGTEERSSVQALEVRRDDVVIVRQNPVPLLEAVADVRGSLAVHFSEALVCGESEVVEEALLGQLSVARARCAALRR